MENLFFVLIGISAGVIAGMGMGGGTLLIPMLTLFMQVNQHSSQMFNLLSFLPMATFALIIHFKNKLVDVSVALPLLLFGVVGSFLGATLATLTEAENLKFWFGIFLIVLGVYSFLNLLFLKGKKDNCK